MTIERIQQAAWIRGIYFSGQKQWLNNMVGYGYGFYVPNGVRWCMCQTLDGAYRMIMQYPKIRNRKGELICMMLK